MRVARSQYRDMANAGNGFQIIDKPGIAGQQRGILLAGIPRADPAIGCFDP